MDTYSTVIEHTVITMIPVSSSDHSHKHYIKSVLLDCTDYQNNLDTIMSRETFYSE